MYWSGRTSAIADYNGCEPGGEERCSNALAVAVSFSCLLVNCHLTWCTQLWKPTTKKCGNRPDSNILLTSWACLVRDENSLSDCLSAPENIHCILLSDVGDRSLALSNAMRGIFEVLCSISHDWHDTQGQLHSRVAMNLQPDLGMNPEFDLESQAFRLAFKVYNDLGCDRSAFVHP